MSLDGQVDVVVVGFGMVGAAAALAAASAGARVLALDRSGARERRWSASPLARSRAAMRNAARVAGVEVRPLCRAHELVVEAGLVRGVGYASLPERELAAKVFRLLDRAGDWCARSVPRVLTAAGDAVWESGFRVEEVGCASVVLALDPCHWDFVGSATAAVIRSARLESDSSPTRRSRHLHLVGDGAATPPTPELSARLWCAEPGLTPGARGELRVDGATGAVWVGQELAVRGLYAAVPVGDAERACSAQRADDPSRGEPGCLSALRAGRRAADAALSAPRAERSLREAVPGLSRR
ncbi:hypothetical protein ACIPX0_23115 [Streptomyces sp. NPDC090075]|uniref:hypothetical protein n=1 Tax=Streptomyces sp. NPDC090075 TaxID=3365937 RepID=UPI0037F90B5C